MLNKEITVLSLFDGMGGGAIALTELGVKFKYFASEVDKFAIAQTKANFPNVIHLGDVRNVDVSLLGKIDLILAGSPCQSFSFAGKQKGMVTKSEIEILTLDQYLELKADGFEFEGQSYLFWEFVRILTDAKKINPDVKFLLENVEMSKHWEGVLSRAVGLIGVHINSNLVSAQNRPRIYWSNIKTRKDGLFGEMVTDIPQPKDRKIFLKDILQPESEVDEKYYLSERMIKGFLSKTNGFEKQFKPFESFDKKANCLTQKEGYQVTNNFLKIDKKDNPKPNQNKASCFTAGAHSGGNHSDMDLLFIKEATIKGFAEIKPGECFDFENPKSKTRRGRKMTDKSNCLMAKKTDFMQYTESFRIRRLTPTEAARLQTVPGWYKWISSDTQIYKMLGNGWGIEVIKHILSYLKF